MSNQTPAPIRRPAQGLDPIDQAVDLTFPASDPVALSITPSLVPNATPAPERGFWARMRRAFNL